MLLLCDESVISPLQIIFTNILSTFIYPDIWKLANAIPIFKKGDKQLIKNYKPISLLPICGKIFEKIIFNSLYAYLNNNNNNNLITKNQSGFVLAILQPTNYYIFSMKSIRPLIVLYLLKLELYFLTYIKPLTRYGMRD